MIWYNDEVVWNIPRFSEVYLGRTKVWQPQFATITNAAGIVQNGSTITNVPTGGATYNYNITYNVPLSVGHTILETGSIVDEEYDKDTLRNPSSPSYHKKSFTIRVPRNTGSARTFDIIVSNSKSLDELARLHFSQLGSTSSSNSMEIYTPASNLSSIPFILFKTLPTSNLNVTNFNRYQMHNGECIITWMNQLQVYSSTGLNTYINTGDQFYIMYGDSNYTNQLVTKDLPYTLTNGARVSL